MDALMLIWLILPILLIHSLWSARKAIQRRKSELAATFGLPPQKGEQEDFQSISAYWRQLKEHNPNSQSVDDITWNDLDMDQVFRRLNICQTSPGEEMLYARLRAPFPIWTQDGRKAWLLWRPTRTCALPFRRFSIKWGRAMTTVFRSLLLPPQTTVCPIPLSSGFAPIFLLPLSS